MTVSAGLLRGLPALCAVLLLGACESHYGFYTPPITVHEAPINPAFGNWNEQNFAAQVINPDPAPILLPPDFDGQRNALAIERYQRGQVIAPEEVSTD